MAKHSSYSVVDAESDDKIFGADVSDTGSDAGGESANFTPISIVVAGLSAQIAEDEEADGVFGVVGGEIVKLPYFTPGGATERFFTLDDAGLFAAATYAEATQLLDPASTTLSGRVELAIAGIIFTN